MSIGSWLYVHLGLNNPNSPWYLFWSGAGADILRFSLIGSLVHVAWQNHRHHKHCHKKGDHSE